MVDDEIVYQFQLSQQRHHADYSTLVKFPGHENNFSAIEHWSCHGSCDLQRNLHLSAAAYAKSGITFQLNFSVLRRAADILCMQIADHQIISFQQFGENPNNILRNMVYTYTISYFIQSGIFFLHFWGVETKLEIKF